MQVTEADFDKCFNVNVKGVFFGTAAVIPRFLKQNRGGSIINIASVGATRPRPGLVWYNSSKGAVWNVSKSVSQKRRSSPSYSFVYSSHSLYVGPHPLPAPLITKSHVYLPYLGDKRSSSRVRSTRHTRQLRMSSSRWHRSVSVYAELISLKKRAQTVLGMGLMCSCRFEAFSGVPDTPGNRAKFLSNVPLGRLCEASDVASACLFFASDESSFVTGVNMEVDGGRAV